MKLTTLLLILGLLVLPKASYGQLCMLESQPQPNSGYAYIRTEAKALQGIRGALTESDKLQPPLVNDPERLHKTVELYTAVQTASDDYDCALAFLTPYKDSKNESIRTSVDSFLTAIHTTKEINADLVEMMDKPTSWIQPFVCRAHVRDLLGQIRESLVDVSPFARDELALACLNIGESTKAIMLDLKEPIGMTEWLASPDEGHGLGPLQRTHERRHRLR
jgi:hypothetical protein